MGQLVDEKYEELVQAQGGTTQPKPPVQPKVAKPKTLKSIAKPGLPKGITRLGSHHFETSGNAVSIFEDNSNPEKPVIQVTTKFADGTIVRTRYDKWKFYQKVMGRMPKETENG